ncbi:MAG: methyl-accepting chemotaxis protein [Candidatus Binatia bacterium]
MARQWTFGQKLGAGFAATVMLAVAIGIVAIYALRTVVSGKDRVITVDAQILIDAERLRAAVERRGGAARAFLLTGTEAFLDRARDADSEFATSFERIKRQVVDGEGRRLVNAMEDSAAEFAAEMAEVTALRRTGAGVETVARAFEERVVPKRDQLDSDIRSFLSEGQRALESARTAATRGASTAVTLVIIIGLAAVLFAAFVALLLARNLNRQIGTAVGQVQSSSAELQAAANQQATGAKEQATAMNEISTTISELLATSRQIAESAQRVAQIADQTTSAARSGDGTVAQAHEAIAGIRRQVDLVVAHMLELGKKSQQIGAVLDIVSELAEQTNILAINATIEAAGAGETGRRFGVVADEIRKLADRVADSTKEIRALIDDVRSAVNTTVMATETGSKAVDAGTRHFGDVALAFKQIGGLVTTTTEAGREIELSTKQQATAVEQVNVAIANVAQATKETEASAGQTLQTASQLATLSRGLLSLVRPDAAA